MDYTLLKGLLEYVEEFQEESPSQRIEDFVIWLNNKVFTTNQQEGYAVHDTLLTAFKLLYANKELKKQTKSVLAQSGISSIDEYSFLLHLNYQESFRKMEIIELHNLEAPTGIEIIKRLVRKDFIEEFADEEDKRAKRIKITETGVRQIQELKPEIDQVYTAFTAPLSLDERIQISGLLDKLIQK
jgi:DNA-binding MarR family transcriptional regulator